MLIIVNIGKISQRVLSWEEAVLEFNLSRIAIYGKEITLSCGTTLTFINIKVVNTIATDVEYSLFQKDMISKNQVNGTQTTQALSQSG